MLPTRITGDNIKYGIEIIEALLDSGANGKFINRGYTRDIHAFKKDLEEPIKVYNVDGTPNKEGMITQYVDLDLEIHGTKKKQRLYVTGLGNQQIILGYDWLKEMNPLIDWKKGTLEWRKWKRSVLKKQLQELMTIEYFTFIQNLVNRSKPKKSKTKKRPVTMTAEEDKEEYLNRTQNPLKAEEDSLEQVISSMTEDDDIWINEKGTKSTEIQIEINKETISVEEQIPKEFYDFLEIFLEEKAARFPEPRTWDHKIELKDTFVPKPFKTYNLTLEEQLEADKFIKENLEKGYIRPSQSPMATPFFFVKKKDGKLRPCQNYRYLNEHTVKNVYPLPLISELLDKLKGARRFTKLDEE
jgi:hypothetical protein